MSTTHTITVTVYAIKADLVNITPMSSPINVYHNGYVKVSAQGEGHDFSWHVRPGERHYWPGDTVTVTVIEDDEPEFLECTSATRPAAAQHGTVLREIDTGRTIVRVGEQWVVTSESVEHPNPALDLRER